jgi:Capsule polysaccharide biosynthesis protein
MRFGFWFDYDQTYTFVALSRELVRRMPGSRVSGFVINDRYWQHALDGLPPGSGIVRFYDLLAEGFAHQPSASELADFKLFDERLNLMRVIYSDRHLAKFSHDQLIAMLVFLTRKFRDYLLRERPDVFVFNCIASQYAHLFYLILVEQKVRVIIPTAYGVEDLFYLANNPYLDAEDIWQTYQRYKAGQELPNPTFLEWAESFIARVRESKPAYGNAAIGLEQTKFALPGPKTTVRYLYNHIRYYRNDPTLPSVHEKVAKVLWLKRNRAISRQLFVQYDLIQGQDFIFFPLHYEPEIATLVISQYDQRSVIDIVARQVPATWKLVVKEHPAMIGQRDHRFFTEIKCRYPNVVLIDPGISSFRLASDARAVLTLNGTVTLEALILGTPAIFLARSRFKGFGLGTFTQDLINFGDVLQEALQKRHTDHDLKLMLASIHQHCHRFEFVEPLGRPSVLRPSNISTIADALMAAIAPKPSAA